MLLLFVLRSPGAESGGEAVSGIEEKLRTLSIVPRRNSKYASQYD